MHASTSILALAGLLAALPVSSRLTEQCNTNYGTGHITFDAAPAVRQELLAVLADPGRNPDVFQRLWEPNSYRVDHWFSMDDTVSVFYDAIQDTAQIGREIAADPVLAALGSGAGFTHVWVDTAVSCFQPPPPAPLVTVTEYYNRTLGHYFMSSSAGENDYIDSGRAGAGWERTGESFTTTVSSACYNTHPVFRFYGAQPNSHFFTVGTDECGFLRNHDPVWQYEGEAFGAYPAENGACVRGRPVYRLYNDRWKFSDSNHRHVTRLDLYQQMQSRGWIGEGVAMCIP